MQKSMEQIPQEEPVKMTPIIEIGDLPDEKSNIGDIKHPEAKKN